MVFLQKIELKKLLSIFVLSIIVSSCTSCGGNSNDDSVVVEPPIDPPVETATFKNPVLDSGADPWVYKDGNDYYVTFTTGNNVTLIKTKKMSELKNGAKKVVWTPPATGFNSKEIWAPELHKINGIWYIYYAASDGNNENHKMWVLENTATDPLQGIWVDKGELKLPDDKWAIDGTPFEINGQYYFAWSGWEGDTNVAQNIYLVKMETPLKVIGDRVCLLKPTNSWETNNVNPTVTEGPQFLINQGKAFLFYSAGGCWTDGYSIGLIWMDISKDPMTIASWERSANNPLFVSNISGGAYGPGHNSFFKSLNNEEDWILYHANPQPGQGCGGNRSTRMQKITWNNGFPVLGTPEAIGKKINKPGGE
jgi:GH43 family beta-xylosidase